MRAFGVDVQSFIHRRVAKCESTLLAEKKPHVRDEMLLNLAFCLHIAVHLATRKYVAHVNLLQILFAYRCARQNHERALGFQRFHLSRVHSDLKRAARGRSKGLGLRTQARRVVALSIAVVILLRFGVNGGGHFHIENELTIAVVDQLQSKIVALIISFKK